jgi:hypothetical protein
MYVSTQSNKCPEYLTKGKKYKAKKFIHEDEVYFDIKDDTGVVIAVKENKCAFVKGNWQVCEAPTLWQRVKSAIGC